MAFATVTRENKPLNQTRVLALSRSCSAYLSETDCAANGCAMAQEFGSSLNAYHLFWRLLH